MKLTIQQKAFLGVVTFLVVAALHCLIAWLAGYNFDHRSHMVAAFAVQTLFDSGFIATWVRLVDTKP
jgi:hypothetical protein